MQGSCFAGDKGLLSKTWLQSRLLVGDRLRMEKSKVQEYIKRLELSSSWR